MEAIKNELQKVEFWLTLIQDSISGLTIGSIQNTSCL